MRAITSNNKKGITSCLKILKKTNPGNYFMYERINVNNPENYTPFWFSLANSLFGELILNILDKSPDILKEKIK